MEEYRVNFMKAVNTSLGEEVFDPEKAQRYEILSELNELSCCNKQYYDVINELTSRLSRIRERVSYEETNAKSLSNDIISIIDEPVRLKEYYENHTKEALEFIDRYLSLNLDDFNAGSLLRKLREILRGDHNE